MLWLRHEINQNDQWVIFGQIQLISLFASQNGMVRRNILIGRCSNADIQIDNRGVSRWHAFLTISYESKSCTRVVLEDNGSNNGTVVNGQKISEPTELKVGDSIDFFGKHRVVLIKPVHAIPPEEWNAGQTGETRIQTVSVNQ